ncbi:MAG TPA: hypothetical protein VKN14_12825 [Flavobacteriaceae bacterium]|nr:hypothetical protein [Flavobacteriaceae bacterium]
MKPNFKLLILLPFFALLMFSSCQDEAMEITETNEEQVFEADSEVAELMSKVATNDGSKDNIIDGANELSLKLPVTVIANGEQIVVASVEDYNKIELNFDAFEDDDDTLEIVYPVTVTLRDHSEVVVNSRTELDALRDNSTDEEDDDIECIDFKYPISFSVYNPNFQVIDVITIENDTQLYRFIHNLEAGVLVSLNFPVTMIYQDGSTIEVNNYFELGRVILEARHICDEDDDNDYNDDDFTQERLNNLLVSCPWVVHDIRRNNTDLANDYREYVMFFFENGVVKVRARNGDMLTGTWSTRVSDHGAKITLEFDTLVDFTLEWFVYEIEPGKIKLFTEGGNRIILRKNCDVAHDPTPEQVEAILQECIWRVARIQIDNNDHDQEYIGTPLKFESNGVVKLRVNGEYITGTWDILSTSAGLALQMSFDNRPELNLYWLITVIQENKVVLENNNSEMLLRRHCPDVDGDLVYINDILIDGLWNFALYQIENDILTDQYSMFSIDFFANGGLKILNPNNQIVDYGAWLAYRNEGLYLGLNFGLDSGFSEFNHRWKIVEVSETRIELHDLSNSGSIERKLVLEKVL